MEIKIIPCEEKYIEKVLELVVMAWTPIYEGYKEILGEEMFNDIYYDWKEKKCERIYKAMTSPRGFVALSDGDVAGFIHYDIDYDKKLGIIEENAVNPLFRGLGIAQKMYDFVYDKMKSESMKYVNVSTMLDDAHKSARRAYEKSGFTKALESINYYKEL